MNKNFILIGSSGYIGSKYAEYFVQNNIPFAPFSGQKCYNVNFLKNFISKYKPNFLLNCAGTTGKPSVEQCEKIKIETLQGNTLLPFILSEVCKEFDITFIHLSTGCLFNGYNKIFSEEDESNFNFNNPPCSFYSGTKHLGEQLIQSNLNSYIFRIRIPFNFNLNSPRNWLYKLLHYHTLLNIKNSATELDEFIKLSTSLIMSEQEKGIYHFVNPSPIFPYEIVDLFLKYNIITRKEHEEKKYFENYSEFEKVITTPRSNCILDTTKLKKAGLEMKDTRTAIEECLIKWKQIK